MRLGSKDLCLLNQISPALAEPFKEPRTTESDIKKTVVSRNDACMADERTHRDARKLRQMHDQVLVT